MAQLNILDEIELKADGYLVLNILSNVAVNLVGIYFAVEISTYFWRMLGCPC